MIGTNVYYITFSFFMPLWKRRKALLFLCFPKCFANISSAGSFFFTLSLDGRGLDNEFYSCSCPRRCR